MKEIFEAHKIDFLFSIWRGLIEFSNPTGRTDNNKHSEQIALKLYNVLYDASFEDLNIENSCGGLGRVNFPGVDLGWLNHYAIQVTSQKSVKKIYESLSDFEKVKQHFPLGIRFLILGSKRSHKISARKIQKHTYFDPTKHVIWLTDLAKEIQNLRNIDEVKYERVLKLLVEEFTSLIPTLFQISDNKEILTNSIRQEINKFNDRLNAFDFQKGPFDSYLSGVERLNGKLIEFSNRDPQFMIVVRFINTLHPILNDFYLSIKKISRINIDDDSEELMSSAKAHYNKIQACLNSFCEAIRNNSSITNKENIITTVTKISEILA